MAEIQFKLSKAEADALAQTHWRHRKSKARLSAESKLRSAIFQAYPDLRDVDTRRRARREKEDARLREFSVKVLGDPRRGR